MAGVKQFDEEAALAAALELFWRQGFAATSMPALAQATGVQRGSLYNAYGDREALFLRAFDLYAARFLEAAAASLQGDDAGQMLTRFFDAAVANMTTGSPSRGCLTTKTATDGSMDSERIRARVQDLLNRLTALVEAALQRPAIRGQLASEPAEAAAIVVTFTRGLAVMERVHGDRAALLRTAYALVRLLITGAAKPPSTAPTARSRRAAGT
ncbi:MAG: TetR/AcrR family transcriptional regulator [Ottowia sp.]|uniref:TetR/AcrR family transcriptional regulator n=1 Tax=Ottowia sp. TaxID=1898956 RepID=UPI0039E71899